MIKNTACSITPAVTVVFNQSISEGKFPTEWKKANITPVPKSNDHSLVENFHPISFLSILGTDILSIFGCIQRGFSQGKSTIGALLTVINNWHQSS